MKLLTKEGLRHTVMSSVNMPKAVPNEESLPGHQGPVSQTVHSNPTASGNELLSSNCLAAAVEW